MNKHQFEMEKERVEQSIRVENIRGLKHNLTQAKHEADIQEIKASEASTKVRIARSELASTNVKLSQARVHTQLGTIKLQELQGDLSHESKKLGLKITTQALQLDGLKTDISIAKKLLDNRREYTGLKGELE